MLKKTKQTAMLFALALALGASPMALATDGAIEVPVATAPEAAPASQPAADKKEGPASVKEAIESGKGVVANFKGGKYREAVAGIIVLVIFLWRRFAAKLVIGKVSTWWVGFITLLLGYLGSIPEALTMDPFSWWTFVWSGLLTGAESMAFYLMLGKKLLPKIFGDIPAKEEPKPAEG
jgi:hypothetical protein